MFWTRADGAGTPQVLTQSKNPQYASSFTPDNKRLAFNELNTKPADSRHLGESAFEIWTLPLESDGARLRAGTPEIFLRTPFDQRHGYFSPDGRWLAYSSDESGTYQVYVRAFPDRGGRWQVSNAGGVYPVFSRNGHDLFFRTEDNRIMVASYTANGNSFAAEKPRMWSEKRLANLGGFIANYDVAPDGKRVAALMPADTSEDQKAQNQVIFLENFFDELRRRVPVSK
jgi:serine/threonine-protein kinase